MDGAVRNKCWGVSDTDKPEVVLLGEAPGRDEDVEGVPFVGPSGRMLKFAVNETEHMWHKSHKTNVIACRPPNNNFGGAEAQEAIGRCRPGLLEELKELRKRGCRIIVAVGASAMKALNIEGSIAKYRGSIFMLKFNKRGDLEETLKAPYDFVVVPTFHPSFLLRGQIKHEVTFANDIDKAYGLVGKRYKPPAERFEMFPTAAYIEKEVNRIIAEKITVGVDIETTGFIPGRARICVVGIATSEEDAFSIPFAKHGGGDYWKTAKERMRAHSALKKLMAKAPTVFQNYLFDGRHLRRFGTPVLKLAHDTMVLNHTISPELPHNLGYIVSVYGKTPYWKEDLSKADGFLSMPDEQGRRYNLRDCVTLLQCLKPMIKEAKEREVYGVYQDIAMPLLKPVIDMIEDGMLIDPVALKKWKANVKRHVTISEKRLREIANLPESFNLSSGDHLRWLLYKELPSQYHKQKAIKEDTENDPKKKTTTKKYRNACAIVEAFEKTEPLQKVTHSRKKTASGSLSVDEEAMLNMQIATTNRINKIKELKRPQPKHVKEMCELQRSVDFITEYRTLALWEKRLSTYVEFPREEDNRVRFPYRTTGTATGRMGSGNKGMGEPGNAQNFPKEAKHLFVAPNGKLLLQSDYSNLELRVLGFVTGDEVLLGVFEQGLNAHSENCKLMFGIDEEHPLWGPARKACKTYIFGRNYGGGLQGIFRRVAKQVPELNLTFEKFKRIDETYREAHPKYVVWVEELEETLKRERCLENGFGRKRYFMGSDQEILREGLNFPIQSTAADILNITLIRLHKAIKSGKLKAKIVGSVHDSLLFEVDEKGYKKVAGEIKKIMEQPVKLQGKMCSFPVDVEVGKDWGNMEKIKNS